MADRSWSDPLSGEHARIHGGRWNAPGAIPVVYLNASREVARALVRSRLEDRGIRPEDLLAEAGPVLVHTVVPDDNYVNAVTDAGLRALSLTASYPLDGRGRTVAHGVCQPIGLRAWERGERGIACRSASRGAPPGGEELAYFDRRSLRVVKTEPFPDWFF